MWQTYQQEVLQEQEVDQQLCEGCAETVDALLALVSALDAARCEINAQGIHNLEHGDRVLEHLSNVSFTGLSGQVRFDTFGDPATSRFALYVSRRDITSSQQWTLAAILAATRQGGVEPAAEEAGQPESVPEVGDIATQLAGPSSTAGDTYGSDDFCSDGTQCVDPSLPHCDIDYDPEWRWEPGATTTVDGVPRNVARGACVSHTDITAHACAAPMHLYQNAQGSAHHMTLHNNETTSCYQKNATSIECRKGGRQQGVVPEPPNVVAGMCAEYLPSYLGAIEEQDQRDVQVCCKLGDRKLESWFFERWQDHEIRFGQCENCRNMARKVLCQTACDINNWRFHVSSKALSFAPTNSFTSSDAVVCPAFCSNAYKACRDVVWSKDIKHMPQYETLDNPESGMFRFCKEGFRIDAIGAESWSGLGSAWLVDANDPMRICTEDAEQDPVHCASDQAYRTKGAVGAILCVFSVLALLGTDKLTNRMLPASSITLLAGFVTGFLIDKVLSVVEEELRGTHDLVNSVLLRPEALGLFLLPTMIFAMAFNMEHHVTIFMWLTIHRITMFAIFGTIASVVCTGGLLLAVDDTLEGGLLGNEMTFRDAMMFGSVLSAIDPTATLAAFARLGVDPRICSLIHGESVLSRCVAVVMFGMFRQMGTSIRKGEDATTGAIIEASVLCIGSAMWGLAGGVLTSLLYKAFGDIPETEDELHERQKVGFVDDDADAVRRMLELFKQLDADKDGTISASDLQLMDADKDGEIDKDEFRARVLGDKAKSKEELHNKRHRAVADACLFVFASFASYFAAEATGMSGIMASSICAIMCNQFAVRNMTFDARDYGTSVYAPITRLARGLRSSNDVFCAFVAARSFYVTLAEIVEQMFMLWVGVLYYMSLNRSAISSAKVSMTSLAIIIVTRSLVVVIFGILYNLICRKASTGPIDLKTQLTMIVAGLRGPVALILVTQMPTSSGEQFLEAVYCVVFWSNVVLGGLTVPLVQFLGVHNEVDGTLDLSHFEFTEEEANYLESIEDSFVRVEDLLLFHAGQSQTFSTSARGRHAALWEAKIEQAKTRKNLQLTDRVAHMPKVKRAQKRLDKARGDKMPGKSAAAKQKIIQDLEYTLKREQRIAARYVLDSSTWDVSEGVSDASAKAEALDTDVVGNPVFMNNEDTNNDTVGAADET